MASEGLQLLGYAGVVVLGAMSPGPDFAVVSRHSALGGRGPGLAASAGVASGMVVNTVVMVLLWFSTVALLVSLLRKAFQRPRVAKVINGLTGLALIAVAGKIALD